MKEAFNNGSFKNIKMTGDEDEFTTRLIHNFDRYD
jgi:hypothetical protein